jgi:hypothetical protein
MWWIKIPLKIKVFMWLTLHNSILTRDILIRRGWKGKDSRCCFCDELETIDHLFFECRLARFVWGVVKCATGILDIPVKFKDLSS